MEEKTKKAAKMHLKKKAMSHESVCRLIELYEERRCLWDRKDPAYRNMDVRAKMYADMSDMLDEPVYKIVDKWANLRTTFGRIMKTYKYSSGGSGSETAMDEGLFSPRWTFFKKMKFLRNNLQKPRPARPKKMPLVVTADDYPDQEPELIKTEIETFVDTDSLNDDDRSDQQSDPGLDFNTPSSSSMQFQFEPPLPQPPSSSSAESTMSSTAAAATPATKKVPLKKRKVQEYGTHNGEAASLLTTAISNLANSVAAQKNNSTVKFFSEFVTSYLEELAQDKQNEAMLEIAQIVFKYRRQDQDQILQKYHQNTIIS